MSTPEPVPAQPLAEHHGNALPLGYRLHEFEVTGLIGEGGFGIVYLARDTQLERTVAIKEYMPASLAARNDGVQVSVRSERHRDTFALGMRSFVNEAKLLASFDHPALIKVYRFWEANGTAYMVMPYYQGPTLKNWLREQKVAPTEAWLKGMLGPLMDALEVIHADHCYHRDIAPDNILMLGPNKPLLLDFGAARRVIGDATQALTVILKPGYAPLEQYAEVPSMKQGPWTDVYALCAVLYAVITGKAPPPSVGRMMKDELVPATVAAAGRYSAPFLAAIDAGLTVHPDKRPHDMAALRELLFADTLLAGHPVPPGAAQADDERTVLMPAPGAGALAGAAPQTAFAQTEMATQLATQIAPAAPASTQMAPVAASADAPAATVFGSAGADEATGSPRVQALKPTATAAPGKDTAKAAKRPSPVLLGAVGLLVALGAGAGFMAWRSKQGAACARCIGQGRRWRFGRCKRHPGGHTGDRPQHRPGPRALHHRRRAGRHRAWRRPAAGREHPHRQIAADHRQRQAAVPGQEQRAGLPLRLPGRHRPEPLLPALPQRAGQGQPHRGQQAGGAAPQGLAHHRWRPGRCGPHRHRGVALPP